MNRRIASTRVEGRPSVVLVVGVNGTGKTTTVGKLARVLVAEDKTVVLGAADTFRAAAADQLETWGERVGVETVRSTVTAPTRRPSPSTRSRPPPNSKPMSSWSTPPDACTTRPT
jgi:signal recognition particle GTPase